MQEDLILQRAYGWEKRTPDRLWLTQPMGDGVIREYTWKQGLEQARRMAAHLESLDLPHKTHIALFSKNTAWWILADPAIMMAGHVSIPLYPTLQADTIRQILVHSDSKLIFVGKLDGHDAMAPGIPEDMPRIVMPLGPENAQGERWNDIMDRTEPVAGEPVRDPDDLATIIYTSGSTGQPKGAMHSFGRMGMAARGAINRLEVLPSDRALSYLPLAHVFERWIIEHCGIFAGIQLYFAESLETFVSDIKRARPTMFVSVPRLWQKFQLGVFQKMPPKKLNTMLKIPILKNIVRKKVLSGLGLDQVRFAGSGSAPIPAELIQWYRDLGLELLEGYGMTENFAFSHASEPGRVRVGYVGETYEGVDCQISEEGEILVRSPANMLGYYKMEEATRDSFTEDGFLKTGDRGELDEMGRLRITGRVKELFKTAKGKYVAPAPIENKLLVHDAVEAACVTGSGEPQPHGIVMLSEGAQAAYPGNKDELEKSLGQLLETVNGELDPHENLAFLVVAKDPWTIENGYLTPTMKLKRNKVEDAYGPRQAQWYGAGQKVIFEG